MELQNFYGLSPTPETQLRRLAPFFLGPRERGGKSFVAPRGSADGAVIDSQIPGDLAK